MIVTMEMKIWATAMYPKVALSDQEVLDLFLLDEAASVKTDQLFTAIGVAEGRISTGTDIDQAFTWLKDETGRIMAGETIYDKTEPA